MAVCVQRAEYTKDRSRGREAKWRTWLGDGLGVGSGLWRLGRLWKHLVLLASGIPDGGQASWLLVSRLQCPGSRAIDKARRGLGRWISRIGARGLINYWEKPAGRRARCACDQKAELEASPQPCSLLLTFTFRPGQQSPFLSYPVLSHCLTILTLFYTYLLPRPSPVRPPLSILILPPRPPSSALIYGQSPTTPLLFVCALELQF